MNSTFTQDTIPLLPLSLSPSLPLSLSRLFLWCRQLLSLSPASAQFGDILYAVKTLALSLVLFFGIHEVSVLTKFDAGQAMAKVGFWISLLLLCLFSNHKLYREFRAFVVDRLHTFFSFGEVKFVDVLTADALTSMSKLLADMQVCRLTQTATGPPLCASAYTCSCCRFSALPNPSCTSFSCSSCSCSCSCSCSSCSSCSPPLSRLSCAPFLVC